MSTINMNKEVNKGGPPFTDIWDHMTKGTKQSKGHYSATCNYCKNVWKHGRLAILRVHLANVCKKCPNDIVLYYANLVGKVVADNEVADNAEGEDSGTDTEEPPKKKARQTAVSSFFNAKKLEKGKIDEIDCAITKAFVMCNIPFNVIENPWFLDLVKTLQPGYDAPSRRVLSGSLLQAELARINIKIHNELLNERNFTIGKNFIIINYN